MIIVLPLSPFRPYKLKILSCLKESIESHIILDVATNSDSDFKLSICTFSFFVFEHIENNSKINPERKRINFDIIFDSTITNNSQIYRKIIVL